MTKQKNKSNTLVNKVVKNRKTIIKFYKKYRKRIIRMRKNVKE